jgi:GTP-binding protein HflX
VPYDRGDLVSAIHEQGMILSQEHEEGGTAVHARVGQHLAARLAPFEV